jgi:hypothetical protein
MGSCIGYFSSLLEGEEKWDTHSVQLSTLEKSADETTRLCTPEPLKCFAGNIPSWEMDAEVDSCQACSCEFTIINRKHHCRRYYAVICKKFVNTYRYLVHIIICMSLPDVVMSSATTVHRKEPSC